jgi:agmatine/peptidylarginine deiminase
VIDEGRRLAASYANYLIVNGAVLMPAYGDPADDLARDVLAQAHPGRDRAGALPLADLAERQPALHHHAAAGWAVEA